MGRERRESRRAGRGANKEVARTIGNARHSKVLVAICLLQGIEDVDIGPVGEHFLDHADLASVFLLELANITFVIECRQAGVGVMLRVAIRGG